MHERRQIVLALAAGVGPGPKRHSAARYGRLACRGRNAGQPLSVAAEMPISFEFSAPIVVDPRPETAHVVPVPHNVARALERAGARRLVGLMSAYPFRRSLHPHSRGGQCLRLDEAWLRETGLAAGDVVDVTLSPDPDSVEIWDERGTKQPQDPEAALQ